VDNTLEIILKLVDKASGGINSVKNNLGSLESKAGAAHRGLAPLTNLFGTVLKASAAAATVAIGGLAAGIVSATMEAADMQQHVADIASVMNTSVEAIAPLKDLIGNLGIDPTLKVNATEAADAIEMLAKNGLDMTEILEGAAKSTVLLSNATGGDFSLSADIATDVMSLFGIEAKNMMTAVNGITGVTVKSKFGINDYRLALAQAGGVAAIAGVDFADFNTVIASIAPFFASGSDAGTSFKTFLQRLVPDTKPAVATMRELGLFTGLSKEEFDGVSAKIKKYQSQLLELDPTSKNFQEQQSRLAEKIKVLQDSLEQGQNAFFTADGSMRSMAEISGILNNATKDLSEEQKIQAFSTIFGTDAMRAAAAVAGMTEESFNKLKGEIGKVDAEQAAKTRMDTLAGSLEILQGIFDGLKLKIGDKFLPVFKNMVDRISEFLSSHADQIIGWAASFADKLTDLLPVGEAILKFLFNFISTGVQLTTSQMGLSGQTEDLVSKFIDFFNWVKTGIERISSFIEWIGGLKTILTIVGALLGISVVAQVITFVGAIVSAFGAVASFVGAITGLGPLLAGVTALFGPVGIAVAAVGGAIYLLYQAWQNNWGGIREITYSAIETVKGWLNALPGWLSGLGSSIFEGAKGAMSRIKDGFEWAKGGAQAAFSAVTSWLGQQSGTDMNALGSTLWNGAKSAMGKLGEGLSAARDVAKGQLNTVLNDIKEQGYSYAVGAMAGRFYEGAKHSFANILRGFTDASPNFGPEVHSILFRIIDTFNGVMDSFRNHVWGVMKGIGNHLVSGLTVGIEEMITHVRNVINHLTSLIPQWIKDQLGIHSDSKVMIELAHFTMGGFVKGLKDMVRQPQLVLEQALGGFGMDNSSESYSYNNTTNWNVSIPGGGGPQGEGQIRKTINTLTGVYGRGR